MLESECCAVCFLFEYGVSESVMKISSFLKAESLRNLRSIQHTLPEIVVALPSPIC